jgi:nucleosome assembly protein 1-like 1
LPAPVKRRLKALKKIQLESTKLEAAFYEEVHKLECKYHEMYKPHYEIRSKITKGKKSILFTVSFQLFPGDS